jgi:hypothetical protein
MSHKLDDMRYLSRHERNLAIGLWTLKLLSNIVIVYVAALNAPPSWRITVAALAWFSLRNEKR